MVVLNTVCNACPQRAAQVSRRVFTFLCFMNTCNYLKMFCKLVSDQDSIPDHTIQEGETFTIGRNRECKIKALKCSRRYCCVSLRHGKLMVQYLKNGHVAQVLSHGDFLTGPGFRYAVVFQDVNTTSVGSWPASNGTPQQASASGDNILWSEHASGKVLIGKFMGGGRPSSKIAAFDYDGTIVITKSGRTFPQNADDWKFFRPRFGDYLGRLEENDYRIVIISNQKGLSTGTTTMKDLKKRFNDSLRKIEVPCLILIATGDDNYRKPRTGLWDYLLQMEQPGISVDLTQSFYVGDAAGREKSLGHSHKDHSSADLYFAVNCGLPFQVPEQFVKLLESGARSLDSSVDMANKLMVSKEIFNPAKMTSDCSEQALLVNMVTGEKVIDIANILPHDKLHCIIFVGLAGSGKSSFYRNHLEPRGYVHVNMDTLKTMPKCVLTARDALGASKNVVIDNINIDRASRSTWLDLCEQKSARPIILYFKMPLPHVFHHNCYRKLTDPSKSLAEVIIYTQNKKLQPPAIGEEKNIELCVYQVNFVPMFTDACHKTLYRMFLNDK